MRVAVIGAGLAGLAAADGLQRGGHEVVVWEKSRGVGGRTATRRAAELRFDHGAPFLHDGATPLSDEPALACASFPERGRASYDAAFAAPTANALAKLLAEELDVRAGVRVGWIEPCEGGAAPAGWRLLNDRGEPLGAYDAVVVTAPAPQAAELLAGASPALAARAAEVRYAACWSVMAAWDVPLSLGWSLARGAEGLSVALREAAKPGRAASEAWVLQADPDLSEALIDEEAGAVAGALLDRFAALAGHDLPVPAHLAAHRWLYARPLTPLPELTLTDGTLIVAGDWCGGSTAGAALRSGRAAAAALAGAAV